MRNIVHGVDTNSDLDPALIRRETRPITYRINEFISLNGGMIVITLGIISIIWPFTDISWQCSDAIFVSALIFAAYSYINQRRFLFRTPIKEGIINADMDADPGLIYMGNDIKSGEAIWCSDTDMRGHLLCFGTTGTGKSVFLLGIFYQALLIGSGIMFVDGKGDNTIYWLIFSLVRRVGRLDDFLLVNYLVDANLSGGDDTSLERLTNTTNPFAYGGQEQLRTLIVGLMRESSGDAAMWKGRANAMISGLMFALCAMRDREEINLDVATVRHYMGLDEIITLSRRTDLPESCIGPLRRYLLELPGYKADATDVESRAYEQHTFLTMQLTEVMSSLSETYGSIFSCQLGEVDFQDVIFQRRIVFVMLPALASDPDTLAGLGKIIVASVRSVLGVALGNKVEGSKAEVIDQKPTNSRVPFFLIFDEYGYYAVKGFALIAAQSRSLGVCCIFAGQDWPSFTREDETEAKSTVACTNTKLFLRVEDAQDTAKLAQDRGGDGLTTQTYGHEKDSDKSVGSGFTDKGETRVETVSRINPRDLMKQEAGEAHVLQRDIISRAQLFYVRPTQVEDAELNKFLMVTGPSAKRLDALKSGYKNLEKLFSGTDIKSLTKSKQKHFTGRVKRLDLDNPDENITQILDDYNFALKHAQTTTNAAIYAVGMSEYRETLEDSVSDSDESNKLLTPGIDEAVEKSGSAACTNQIDTLRKKEKFDEDETLEILVDENAHADLSNMKEQATKAEKTFAEILAGTVERHEAIAFDGPMTQEEREQSHPFVKLKIEARRMGLSEEDAELDAEKASNQIDSPYPNKPIPTKKTQETMTSEINRLIGKIEASTNL